MASENKNPGISAILFSGNSGNQQDAPSAYEVIRISPEARLPVPGAGTPVYATHCHVDLRKWRRKAKSWLAGTRDWPEDGAERHNIIQTLSCALLSIETGDLPQTIVMAWSSPAGITTHYALVDNMIFLNKSLSENWTHGHESNAALHALIGALQAVQSLQSETMNIRFS